MMPDNIDHTQDPILCAIEAAVDVADARPDVTVAALRDILAGAPGHTTAEPPSACTTAPTSRR